MTFSTGTPFRVAIDFLAHTRIEDIVLKSVSIPVFGNLHTHFSTKRAVKN